MTIDDEQPVDEEQARRAPLAAEATEWARDLQSEEPWGPHTGDEKAERFDALLVRARDAGLSNGQIAEMLNRAQAEAKPEDAKPDAFTLNVTEEHVIGWMRNLEGDERHQVQVGSAIWGGATIGLVVGLILGFFVGSSYWRTVLIAVAIGAAFGIAANLLASAGNVIARRGRARR